MTRSTGFHDAMARLRVVDERLREARRRLAEVTVDILTLELERNGLESTIERHRGERDGHH